MPGRAVLDLQKMSSLTQNKEQRRLIELEIRRKQVVKLLSESNDRACAL
jgi:hypothetical protein